MKSPTFEEQFSDMLALVETQTGVSERERVALFLQAIENKKANEVIEAFGDMVPVGQEEATNMKSLRKTIEDTYGQVMENKGFDRACLLYQQPPYNQN